MCSDYRVVSLILRRSAGNIALFDKVPTKLIYPLISQYSTGYLGFGPKIRQLYIVYSVSTKGQIVLELTASEAGLMSGVT